jgi:penicillin-binding protein 1A
MGRAGRERREPRFDEDDRYDGGLRLDDEDRVRHSRRRSRADDERPRRSTRRRSRNGRGLFGNLIYWGFTLALWGAIALAGVIGYFAMKLPPIDQLAVPKRPPNVAILAADGTLIANRGETGGANVPIGEVPNYLPKAFVAIEDRRFYQHFGVDPVGLARALARNLTAGRTEQGGSTLTQQLAKNLFLTQERTFSRKIQEALLALWLERNYSKDQILELYMNRVYFGSGAYGVEAASQRYFGKSARALTLGEAAVLAGLVQSPSRLAPNRNPEGAAERAAVVLSKMVDQGYATADMAKLARTNTTEARRRARPSAGNYVADWVMDVLDDHIGTIDKDIIVKTTIEPRLQSLAERLVATEFEQKRLKLNVEQIAMVVMSPDGAVRALVGGRDYAQSQYNRAVMAKRQPGSSFKPFVYLTALEKGLTPETIREDSPVNIKGWKPENYTREHFGAVTLTQALAMSLNTVPVKLTMEFGPRAVVRTAQRLGISSGLRADASLSLGTSEVSPLEITTAYAAFANGGTGVISHAIVEVKSADGKLIYRRQPQTLGQVADAATIGALNRMMRQTLVSGTARKSDISGWQAAGKTGTTQDHRDAWFIGYTAQLVASVWVGNDDGDPMRKVTGSGLPAELWASYMREALAKTAPQPLPGLNEGRWLSPPPQDPRQPPPRSGDTPDRLEGPSSEERSLLSRLFWR